MPSFHTELIVVYFFVCFYFLGHLGRGSCITLRKCVEYFWQKVEREISWENKSSHECQLDFGC